ncbi:LysR family transcriptional regulator [Paraburkholderia sp. EG287B]|uniref:LysR family transcriptional regulator n=1 Tax=Paraburkholderia sp. EG287B TaxID=3237010 RepID=UPI0034D2D132
MDKLDMMRIFVRIAEEGSFTGAAARLDIQTNNASRAVSQLESQLRLQRLTAYAVHASRKFLDARIKTFMDSLREAVPKALAADAQALSRAAKQS